MTKLTSGNLPTAQMDRARDKAMQVYKELGSTDNVAKTSTMSKKVLAVASKAPLIKL